MTQLLFEYRDSCGNTRLGIIRNGEGIIFSYISVFDTQTWQTDTIISCPFPVEDLKSFLSELGDFGACSISNGHDLLAIERDGIGTFKLSLSGRNGDFELHDFAIEPDRICRELCGDEKIPAINQTHAHVEAFESFQKTGAFTRE